MLQADSTKVLYNGLKVAIFFYFFLSLQQFRALDLATKHHTHIETVLYFRKQYLDALQKSETNEKFLALKDEVSIDPNKVCRSVDLEYEKEKEHAN